MTIRMTRGLVLLTLLAAVLSLGCDDEPSAEPAVDAEVDATIACDPEGPGHEYCKNLRGDGFFCASTGLCAELQPCESDDCCAPGQDGDQYCVDLCTPEVCPEANARFGFGSVCEPTEVHGQCTARACLDCTYDNAGHGCCAGALGATWYCGGDGRCVDAGPCASEDCCVPGDAGDARCAMEFGDGSTCNQIGTGWACLMPQAPPCAGCRADAEGHTCCREHPDHEGDPWFCSQNMGICQQSSGCTLEECCIPGHPTDGDPRCAASFGAESTCEIQVVEGRPDGRCSRP